MRAWSVRRLPTTPSWTGRRNASSSASTRRSRPCLDRSACSTTRWSASTPATSTKPTDDSVSVGLPDDLPNGTYVVAWRVISADSHPIRGAFAYSVGDEPVGDTSGHRAGRPRPGGGLGVRRPRARRRALRRARGDPPVRRRRGCPRVRGRSTKAAGVVALDRACRRRRRDRRGLALVDLADRRQGGGLRSRRGLRLVAVAARCSTRASAGCGSLGRSSGSRSPPLRSSRFGGGRVRAPRSSRSRPRSP